jgi:hypothetical protein
MEEIESPLKILQRNSSADKKIKETIVEGVSDIQ